MAKITQAGLYIIKQDEDGNVLLFLPLSEGKKNNPLIIYDGKEHALFVKNEEQNIILDYVNPEMREILQKALGVIVVEVEGQEAVDNYLVNVRHVESIPIDWKQYGLSTWDEASKENKKGSK